MFSLSKLQMEEYYSKYPKRDLPKFDPDLGFLDLDLRSKIYNEMDEFYKNNPNLPTVLLKSKIHTLIANYCRPKIFRGNPFFFEIGLRERDSWGIAEYTPAYWMHDRIESKLQKEHPIGGELLARFERLFDLGKGGVCNIITPFDLDHHSIGYTNLFSLGVDGLLEQIAIKKSDFESESEEYSFLLAAEESLKALLTVAERFSKKAEEMLADTRDERERAYLKMIRDTATIIPKNPPKTFYEGLAMLLFTREVIATFENIGISQLGHVDKLLSPLYEKDLAEGRITEEGARELVALWMMHTDIRFDLENNIWPETSTCIQLGGCDREGKPVFNDVTRIFIEEHMGRRFINPKLNCRYDKNSPTEYLELIGKAELKGHNNFVLINDDVIISGLVKNGVQIEDARMYVNGGCQETMLEGLGHTEGASIYISLPRMLDLFLREDNVTEFIKPIENPSSFEEFYSAFLDVSKRFLSLMTEQRNVRQYYNKSAVVCPLFSATQTGCIEKGKDYVYGGAKYNFSTIGLVGLATVSDSLYAIKELVFNQKIVTLEELNTILQSNWEGHEDLRRKAISIDKYGCNKKDVDAFANGFLTEITEHMKKLKNERGGNYIPSLFVYYFFEYFSGPLRATPDGRRKSDLISMGCAPSQLNTIKDLTTPVNSMNNIDFTNCFGGNAVLDVKLPYTSNFTPELFAAFIRSCGELGCPTLQPNVVSAEELVDAKINPEKHKDLIVRVSGLSAYFIALPPHIQDEIIARNTYSI